MSEGFRLAAVGDVVLTRPFLDRTDVDPRFIAMIDELGSADVVFGDLETVLSDQGYPREKLITLKAAPALVAELERMHFGVFSLANNHSMDFGETPLLETIETLQIRGIKAVGAGMDLDAAIAPVVVSARGVSVAFLAASSLLPVGSAASAERPGLAPLHVHTKYEVDAYIQMEEPGHPPVVRTTPDEQDLARICAQITAASQTADFVVVSVHMGFGFGEALSECEQLIGKAAIDAGADLVLGNHVHAIHGIETYRGRCIHYSPGNFVAQQPREGQPPEILAIYEQMSDDAYLSLIDVAADGSYRMQLAPVVMNEVGQPIRAEGADAERILERIVRLSTPMGTPATVAAGTVVVDVPGRSA
ncbi:MAG: CapA family protein [Geodermatophilaceae bacterium]